MTTSKLSHFLVADTRERSVHPFLANVDVEVVNVQIAIGDYLIMSREQGNNEVVACFERKTLNDYAASFKDGRYENFEKLRVLRETTGCDLYLIVEGPAFPAPNTKYQGIEYYKILASMTQLMVRDKIQIIHSKDESYTADRLVDVTKSYIKNNIQAKKISEKEKKILEQIEKLKEIITPSSPQKTDHIQGSSDSGSESDSDKEVREIVAGCEVPKSLTTVQVRPNKDVAVDMWSTLSGIAGANAKILSQKMSLLDLVTGAFPLSEVAKLKTAGGKKLTPIAQSSLYSVICASTPHIVRMLTSIPQITETTVTALITHFGGTKELLLASIDEMSAVQVEQKTRKVKVGSKAAKLYEMIRFRDA